MSIQNQVSHLQADVSNIVNLVNRLKGSKPELIGSINELAKSIDSTFEKIQDVSKELNEAQNRWELFKPEIELLKRNSMESSELIQSVHNLYLTVFKLIPQTQRIDNQCSVNEQVGVPQFLSQWKEHNRKLFQTVYFSLKDGKLDEALALARKIPEEMYKTNALKVIAESWLREGNLEDALSATRDIQDETVKSDMLREIAISYLAQRKPERSFLLVNEIPDESKKNSTLREIMERYFMQRTKEKLLKDTMTRLYKV